MAVEQHQGALGAEIAQVQHIAGEILAAVAGASDGLGALENRKLVQPIGEIAWRGVAQLLRRDHGHRRRGIGGVGNHALNR